jgi:hypothetical protein
VSLAWSNIDAELQFNSENVLPHEPLDWRAERAGALLLRIESGSEFLLDQALKLSGYRGCILYDPEFENWDLSDLGVKPRQSMQMIRPAQDPQRMIVIFLTSLWRMPESRIVFEGGAPEEAVHGRPQQVSREGIEAHYRIIVRRETRITNVMVLTAPGKSEQIRVGEQPELMVTPKSGSFAGLGQTIKEIAEALEAELKIPIVNETGLTGVFDFSAYSTRSGREAAIDWVRQLGWELKDAERPIEELVVRSVR